MFLLLWLALIVVKVLVGFGGAVYEFQPDAMPPRGAVEYGAFLPGGYGHNELQLDVDDPNALPTFDPTITRRRASANLFPWNRPSLSPARDDLPARLILSTPACCTLRLAADTR